MIPDIAKIRCNEIVPEIAILILLCLSAPLLITYLAIAHVIDYKVLKSRHLGRREWSLNIACGETDGGGINADIVKRELPNFRLIKDVYDLPFRDKQFDTIISSHTIEHLAFPDQFYKELKRVSKNVVLLVPPLWDISALLAFREHRWQFLTLRTKHVNSLPGRFRLPYWWYQKRYGQEIRC